MAETKNEVHKTKLGPSQQHVGPYDTLLDSIADINSGEKVRILLDAAGKPTSIQREVPAFGVAAIAGQVGNLYENSKPHLTTGWGSELGDHMTPNPDNNRMPIAGTPPPPPPEGGATKAAVKK